MKIQAVKCLHCHSIVFSRTRHDFRSCLCGKVSIDGGFDYVKVSAVDLSGAKCISIDLSLTKQQLYDDWNSGYDKYGILIERNIQTENGEKKILCHIRPV